MTTGRRLSDRATDAKGAVLVGGLATFTPVTVGVDESSLADPMLVPRKALQVVVPRPGVPATVEIGLVGGGDIEGAIVKSGGLGFEGLALELVDSAGKLIASTQTDFDGFFPVRALPYGAIVRLSAETLSPQLPPRAQCHRHGQPRNRSSGSARSTSNHRPDRCARVTSRLARLYAVLFRK